MYFHQTIPSVIKRKQVDTLIYSPHFFFFLTSIQLADKSKSLRSSYLENKKICIEGLAPSGQNLAFFLSHIWLVLCHIYNNASENVLKLSVTTMLYVI